MEQKNQEHIEHINTLRSYGQEAQKASIGFLTTDEILSLYPTAPSELRSGDGIDYQGMLDYLSSHPDGGKVLGIMSHQINHVTSLPPSTSISWKQNLYEYLYINWIFISLAALQFSLWMLYFFYHFFTHHSLWYSIAKGFGLNIRVASMLLYLLMMKNTVAATLYHHKAIHSYIGFSLLFSIIGHVIAHLINLGVIDGWSMMYSALGITGILLIGLYALIASTSFLRKSNYLRFINFHYLYLLWIPLTIAHVPYVWPYLTVILGLFIMDKMYEWRRKITSVTLANSRNLDINQAIYLTSPRNHLTYPGAYYKIVVPGISWELHPFTVASSSSSAVLSFFIDTVGDWTQELWNKTHTADRCQVKAYILGPYLSPTSHSLDNPNARILLVATGIGISPFFSVIATKLDQETSLVNEREVFRNLFQEQVQTYNPQNLEDNTPTSEIRCVWSFRDPLAIMEYLKYLELTMANNKEANPSLFLDIYITGLGGVEDCTKLHRQALLVLYLISKSNNFITIRFGRPNISKIIDDFDPDRVYYCGSPGWRPTVHRTCLRQKTKILFDYEEFD